MRYSLSNFIVLFIFLLGALFLISKDYIYLSLPIKYLLIISYIICCSVIFAYLITLKIYNYIPILPLTCFFFLVSYLSSAFFNFEIFIDNQHSNVEDLNYAINILFFGILSFIAGFFLTMLVFKKYIRTGINFFNSTMKEIFIYGLLINSILILLYYFFKIQNFYPSLFQIKYPLLLLGFALFTNYIYHSKSIFSLNVLIILCFKFYIILSELITGSYALPFILIFLDYIYYSYLKKKIFISPIILFILVFFVTHEGKEKFRQITWEIKSEKNYYEKAGLFYRVYKNMFNGKTILNIFDGKNQTNRRMAHSFESLVIVTSKTPEQIPYWNGYSYHILKSKILPRIFWKDKPNDELGNEFGHRYKILTDNKDLKDTTTSWNMPVLNEFYVNFGLNGVIFGMFLIGFFFGLLTKYFSFQNNLNLESIFSFYLFIPLFFLESHLSLLIGALIQSYIFLIIISLVFLFLIRKILKLYL